MLDAWFQKIILLCYDVFVAAIIRYVAKIYLFNPNFMLFFWIDEILKS